MGSPIGLRRGRLRLLAGLAFALTALLSASASASGATGRAKGLDVSNWNGTVRWAKVAAAGYRFAFGKATEGTTYTDAKYTTNRNGSETAGLVFGAYHFARPSGAGNAAATASAIAQANHFLAVAAPQPGELPPVLDLEATGNLSNQRLLVWTLAWLEQVYARTGVQPFLYTSPNFWKLHLGNSTAAATAGTDLWVAHWTTASQPLVPAQNWDGNGWAFWQWSNCVSVPGITHCSDADRMNGTNPVSAAINPFPTGLPLLSIPPTIVGPAEAGELLAAVPGTWEGGKPLRFSYQWTRCDGAGAGCSAISGAAAESYRPVSADVGHSLKVVVTAVSAAGSASAATAPTAPVSPAGTSNSAQPANVAPPQILGTEQAGQMLTSSVGTWTGSPKKYAYRWRRCNAGGSSCVAIPHATQSHYTLTPDDIGSALSLVVTATGAGGSASATAATTGIVVAAPLPSVSIGTQTVRRGIAGNLQTDDGRATVTWQPGAVPVGRIVSLAPFDGALTVGGSGVSLTVPGLGSKGFRWPLDLKYAQPQPGRTALGYSTDGKVYHPVPPLQPPQLPPGTVVGWYVDSSNLTHVLTRTPLELALFRRGAWGDPTYTSPNGPALKTQIPLEVLPHRSDHSILLQTRLSLHSQARMSASVIGLGGKPVPILGKGSRLGARLRPGAFLLAQAYLSRPGTVVVQLRLNSRRWRPGSYRARFVALDPWGRRSVLTLRFRYP
ncbi:MAG TPA: glycoside hydrolase family 25 protein [Gaiellaceae bacterium]|nr:glycoside hydrolase family 25 protein [Gaiellaceae bacterium]